MPDVQTTRPDKPLIFADDPYDGLDEALAQKAGEWDLSYVPGYSEKNRENQRRAADGLEPLPLPRMQWVRISNRAGRDVEPTDEGMMTWRRLGYMAVGTAKLKELAAQYWPDIGYHFPAQAFVAADGTIRRSGDVALFYVPQRRAESNRNTEAQDRAGQQPRRLEPEEEGLELYQDERTEKRNVSPREAMSEALPDL